MRSLKTLRKLYDEESHLVVTEKGSPPRVLFSGEDFLLEDLPIGSRIIYPRAPLEAVPNLKATIRYALNHPQGMEPLHALLRPGMKVTVALDDISLPLPPMRTPDVRQSNMEPARSALHRSTERIGRVIDQHLKVFHIETAINNRMFDGQLAFLGKKEEDYTEFDRLKLQGMRYTLSKMPRAAKRKLFMSIPAPYDVIGVHAGATEPTHEKTLELCWKQYVVPVDGQADIVIYGVPYISPYNVNSILNPLLLQVMGLGYFFNLNRGVPLVKKGGV